MDQFSIILSIAAIIFKTILLTGRVHCHGRLWEPPSRSSMWRRGYNVSVNINDNELNCGGFQVIICFIFDVSSANFASVLRGMDARSGKEYLSKLFCVPSKTGSTLNGIACVNIYEHHMGFSVQERKEEVTSSDLFVIFHTFFIITTVELQWLEHLWDYGNLFKILLFRATEG